MHLLRAPAVARELPAGLGEKIRVCGGFTHMLAQRPALAALATLKNASDPKLGKIRRKELLSPFNFAAFYLPRRSGVGNGSRRRRGDDVDRP